MPYEIDYSKLSRHEGDMKAIADAREYIGEKTWLAFMEELSEPGKPNIQQLNMMLGLAGVTGRPFHAICRKFCLIPYREWMHSGNDARQTDEQGFPLDQK